MKSPEPTEKAYKPPRRPSLTHPFIKVDTHTNDRRMSLDLNWKPVVQIDNVASSKSISSGIISNS
jgi:hypothetical protein